MKNLIEAIKHLQKTNHMSDGYLATILRLDRSTLSYVKSGEREIGVKFLSAVVNELPDLIPEVLLYLRDKED